MGIQVKRGLAANLPATALSGEPLWTTDGNKLYIGTGGGRIEVGNSAVANLSGTNTGDQTITLTGDVTGSGTGSFAATIAANAVSNAKLAQIPTAHFKARITAGTGDVENLSASQVKTLLDLAGTNTGDQTITLTGDVTGSGTGSFAATIASDAVTNAKLANMATSTFKGRTTAGTGDPEDLSVAQAKTLLNLAGTNSGDVTLTAVGSSPNANGASLSTQALTLQPADGSNPGVVSTGSQTFAGAKTFSGNVGIGSLPGAPGASLDIKTNIADRGLRVYGLTASDGVDYTTLKGYVVSSANIRGIALEGSQVAFSTGSSGGSTSSVKMTIDTNGNGVMGSAALATNATDGFFYIASCAGAPSGTPTSFTGRTPMLYDTTNNRFYIYNGGWKSVVLA